MHGGEGSVAFLYVVSEWLGGIFAHPIDKDLGRAGDSCIKSGHPIDKDLGRAGGLLYQKWLGGFFAHPVVTDLDKAVLYCHGLWW
jgi:hypothetical protein